MVYPVARATPNGRREYEVRLSSFNLSLFSFSSEMKFCPIQGGGGVGGFEDMGFIRKSSHPVAVVIVNSFLNSKFCRHYAESQILN